MLKKLALIVVALLVILVIVIMLQPGQLTISRSATIPAPQEVTYALVNDFHSWDRWSPWAKRDPNMKVEHSGAPSGKGAIYYWKGNSDVGEGRMNIDDSRPYDHIRIFLEFIKPIGGQSYTDFDFTPQGDQTRVTWKMEMKQSFLAKAMGLLMDMDAMIGQDFENGLAQLATAAQAVNAERTPPPPPAAEAPAEAPGAKP